MRKKRIKISIVILLLELYLRDLKIVQCFKVINEKLEILENPKLTKSERREILSFIFTQRMFEINDDTSIVKLNDLGKISAEKIFILYEDEVFLRLANVN